MEIFWFFPTSGEGRYLATTVGARPITLGYLRQIAGAIDELGYAGALLPTGQGCEDAWVTASALMPFTRRLKFLVAVRPGLSSPGLAARMAATFDRFSEGRLLINVVSGGDPDELAGDGVHLSHGGRYDLTDEFLTVWRCSARARPFNSTVNTCKLWQEGSRFCRFNVRTRRSISAAHRRLRTESPPVTRTFISPGANAWRLLKPRSKTSKREQPSSGARCGSGSGFMSSSARPNATPGPPPIRRFAMSINGQSRRRGRHSLGWTLKGKGGWPHSTRLIRPGW